MKASITWLQDKKFEALSGSGHKITIDADKPGEGPAPMETLLLGIGGCAAVNVLTILERARQNIKDCNVQLEAIRADATPSVLTQVSLHFIIQGDNLNNKQVERAINLTVDKYCSAIQSLVETNFIATFEIQ